MHLIAEVVYGPHQQRKAVVRPGETLSVGADLPAKFVITKDRALSKVHFELSWDGEHCQVRDLDSVGGTLLQGKPIREASVEHGSWIRAGRTDIMVYFEHNTAPVGDDGPPQIGAALDGTALDDTASDWRTVGKRHALELLRARNTPLYAVLDAARARYIRILLRESVERYRSLYDGIQGEALADEAPYLVSLPTQSVLLEKLVRHGWGNRWGIFIESKRRFDDLRRHLRRFLMVANGVTKERMYFRFYDPNTLRVFMRVATAQQKQAFENDMQVVSVGEPARRHGPDLSWER